MADDNIATADGSNATSNTKLQAAYEEYKTQLAASSASDMNSDAKLAASIEMNNVQAQAINQYQSQLATLQSQLVANNTTTQSPSQHDHSTTTQFEIYVCKDTFKFNASHFVAYPGFRERLHGHSYRASVKLLGNHQIGRDGYVLDFGCVKSVTKDVCKKMNEYFIVPMLSEVLNITVHDDGDGDEIGKGVCGECDDGDGDDDNNNKADGGSPSSEQAPKKRELVQKYPGSVEIVAEDGSTFIFPRQDCLLLPIMHSTAEELAIYLYGKILEKLDASYLHKRGVKVMEVTVSEAVGQDAVFRCAIPTSGVLFNVADFITKGDIPVMPCATETEAVEQRKKSST